MASLAPPAIQTQRIDKRPDTVKDGYTTYDGHSSDEDTRTRGPNQADPKATQASHEKKARSNEPATFDDPAPIYEKPIGDARRPKEEDVALRLGLIDEASQSNGSVHKGSAACRKRAALKAPVFEIMHNWTQKQQKHGLVAYITVSERKASSAYDIMGGVLAGGHVCWQHSQQPLQNLREFEQLFNTDLGRIIRDRRITQTTRSLLERVKLIAERKTVGGRYLITGPVRYDGVSLHETNSSIPCMFFSFPYFAVGDFDTEGAQYQPSGPGSKRGSSPYHPVRMLLQSRYRLESTQDRDKAQSITKLSTSEIQESIQMPPDVSFPIKSTKRKQVIHVPQLWGLSVSGDIMVTCAPHSQEELRGSLLQIKKSSQNGAATQLKPAIVRIHLEYEGKKQPFVYPVDQCNWYFGLLNKIHRILHTLGKDKPSKDEAREFSYGLYSKEQRTKAFKLEDLVTSENWLTVLRDTDSEQLDLWMEREPLQPPAPPTTIAVTAPGLPGANVKGDGGKTSGGAVAPIDPSDPVPRPDGGRLPAPTVSSTIPSPTGSKTGGGNKALSVVSMTSGQATPGGIRELTDFVPFLQWPFDGSKKAADQQYHDLKLWLDDILMRVGKTRFKYLDDDLQSLDLIARSSQTANLSISSTSFPPISRSSYGETRDQIELAGSQAPDEIEAVCKHVKYLMALFAEEGVQLPTVSGVTSEHPLIQLYWGLQQRLMEGILGQKLHATELTQLVNALGEMVNDAELLHKGVRKHKSVPVPSNTVSDAYENIDSLVIQTPIPDALEHAIDFIFEVVMYMSTRSAGEPAGNFSEAVKPSVKAVEQSLSLARGYLIDEADHTALETGLGPTVTPEAITLLLLERLSRGVYNEGTINIPEIYEKIVERLASQVESKASRRLLLKINRVAEEIQIILDVLNQQKRFFEVYRRLLDPAGFKPPTAKRLTMFPYEDAMIRRNIRATEERIGDCEDLLKRADRLAVQNVQLVESNQDDNNKTLMIFTFVTIIFLPLSFVTGFFGMNVEGISGTTATVRHFWIIAIPITVGVGLISLILMSWGRLQQSWLNLRKWLNNAVSHEERGNSSS